MKSEGFVALWGILINGRGHQVKPKLWLVSNITASVHFHMRLCIIECKKYSTLMQIKTLVSCQSYLLHLESGCSSKIFERIPTGLPECRVDESLADRESAATSLQHCIGRVHSHCTFNTSCVDQKALMSTLWDLSCWQRPLWSYFLFQPNFLPSHSPRS